MFNNRVELRGLLWDEEGLTMIFDSLSGKKASHTHTLADGEVLLVSDFNLNGEKAK